MNAASNSLVATPRSPPTPDESAALRWRAAERVAALLAVDGHALGGLLLVARPGPAIDRWREGLAAISAGGAVRRMPPTIGEAELFGGLDVSQTLVEGRPVVGSGFLARSDGGIIVVSGAERLERRIAAGLTGALDRGGIALQRDGLDLWQAGRFALVAIDESAEGAGQAAEALAERLAFRVALDGLRLAELQPWTTTRRDAENARALLARVSIDDAAIAAICEAAMRVGIGSPRAPILAVRAARAIAALGGRATVCEDDVREAAQLVLAPRARALPPDHEPEAAPPQPPSPPGEQASGNDDAGNSGAEAELGEILVAAVLAALPSEALAGLAEGGGAGRSAGVQAGGRAGARVKSRERGRQVGTRGGRLEGGARLDVMATLRAAAPWQRLRSSPAQDSRPGRRPLVIRREDIRLRRFEEHRATLTIFAVDASGSAALHRLGEAKGAVEIMLARCYVRRDHVALVTFRGRAADLSLPPTRALARARRALAGLPGGGGTPLACALDMARDVALEGRRRGQEPVVILLTDCRTNVARDGSGGRPAAERDARASAETIALAGIDTLLIDTSLRPHTFASELQAALHARYLHLPNAASETLAASAALMTGQPAKRRAGPSSHDQH